MYISSHVKSAVRKFSEGQDHDCDPFMSGVSVLYKTCVSHLAKSAMSNPNGLQSQKSCHCLDQGRTLNDILMRVAR